MKSYEILWNLMKSYEILWNLMKSYEILWNLMKSYEILWNLMKSYEILWNLMKSYEILWNLMNIACFNVPKNSPQSGLSLGCPIRGKGRQLRDPDVSCCAGIPPANIFWSGYIMTDHCHILISLFKYSTCTFKMYIFNIYSICIQYLFPTDLVSEYAGMDWNGTGWDLCGHFERTRFKRFQILRLQSLQRQGEDDPKGSNVLFPWPRWLGKYLLKCEILWNFESGLNQGIPNVSSPGELEWTMFKALGPGSPYSITATCQGRSLWLDLWDLWILRNEAGDVRRGSHDWLGGLPRLQRLQRLQLAKMQRPRMQALRCERLEGC